MLGFTKTWYIFPFISWCLQISNRCYGGTMTWREIVFSGKFNSSQLNYTWQERSCWQLQKHCNIFIKSLMVIKQWCIQIKWTCAMATIKNIDPHVQRQWILISQTYNCKVEHIAGDESLGKLHYPAHLKIQILWLMRLQTVSSSFYRIFRF